MADKKKVKTPKDEKLKEKDAVKEVLPEPILPPVSFLELFRYASAIDKILVFIGVLAAVASGITMPGMVILLGKITDEFVKTGQTVDPCTFGSNATTEAPSSSTEDPKDILDTMLELSLIQIGLGSGQLLVGYFFITCFNRISESMVHRLRRNYLSALLRQNIGWFDTNQNRNFVSRIAEDAMKVQDATGEKVGLCVFFISTSMFSIGTAFYYGWLLTLVVLCSAPALAIATGVVMTIQGKLAATEQEAYAKAGTVAQEAITNIRTVMAFGGHAKEVKRYEVGLASAKYAGNKRGAISATGMALVWLIMFCSYALAFWYGTKLVLDGAEEFCETKKEPAYSGDNMLIVFMCVLMGAFNIAQCAQYVESIAVGRGAAATIYAVIDRVPEIDSYSDNGVKPSLKASGAIKFENVEFAYPSRPEVTVLNNLSLQVEPGQTVALVGHSGCGKSTCIQLLQRFYDPLNGTISLDGTNVTNLHLGWLRSQIGLVSQEPTLFNTTICENIRYGRENVTQKEIEEACRQANAHNFISRLPNVRTQVLIVGAFSATTFTNDNHGYNTLVGDRGAQLSGGQKQRVAIARALVRNPSILLLDEATSALDTESESVVQKALDRARQGRTTLIVAHRLSTIRSADLVVVLHDGHVVEQGTHRKLLELKGMYYQLVTSQMNANARNDSDDDPDDDENDAENNNHGRKLSESEQRRASRKSLGIEDQVAEIVPVLAGEDLSEKQLAKEAPIRRLLGMNLPELKWMITGFISSVIQGSIFPLFAIIFGEFLGVLSDPDRDQARKDANLYAIYFVLIGILAGVSMFLQMFSFSYAGEALTSRLRKQTFAAMLRQECGWYDDPSNNVGALCARLASDAASVQGATGSQIGTVLQSFSTIGVALGIGMYYIPKLGAVSLAFVPLIGVSSYFQMMMLTGQNVKEKKAIEESSKFAVQAVSHIRTVASLCKEKRFVKMYDETMEGPHRLILRSAHFRGLTFGFAQSMPLFAYAAIMYYGATLIKNEGVNYADIMKVAQGMIYGTMTISRTLAFAPNYNKGKVSGARILKLLDRKPAIDDSPGTGLQIKDAKGSVAFEKVEFNYPTRPAAKILRGLSLMIQPGEKIALVGPSGSGKSTCIQLILRYYDPISGQVKLDDVDVSTLNVNSLRSQMAIVAQEPALFDRTLRENISYGDNSREVTMEEIIEAARQANIHSFITGLPAGYETRVGEMGSQLSGGQKQRVAISRALIRNPKLLLLDEATSALDMESEEVVNLALDAASAGRTSITIAHRLASIQNVDRILVINNGTLAEMGTHSQLLEQKGIYYGLWHMQGPSSTKKQNGHAKKE